MKLFGAGKPDHPFADLKEARRVLDHVATQPLKALEELAHWHESVAAAERFKPEDRAQRLALIDETAQPRVRKQAQDYLAAARAAKGSRAQENLMWTRIHEYWRHAGQAYARCIDSVLQGGKTLEIKVLPGVMVAALRALGQQLKWQHLRYGPIDSAVWGLLNRIYGLAEARGVAEAQREFLKIALFSASSPEGLQPAELEIAERLIDELAGSFVLAKAAATELPYWTDLGQSMAPARTARAPQPAPGQRFIGPGPALSKLRSLIEFVQAKHVLPSDLKLGAGQDPEAVLGVMQRLALYWAPTAPERKHRRVSMKSGMKIAHGFDGVVEALGGGGSLDFGAGAGDSWTVENVSAGGFGALAQQAKSEWLKVGALVAAQPDGTGNWMVGTVRRVSKVSSQEVRVGVETLSRSPSLSQFALRNATHAQGVLLPSPGSGEPAIALRAGVHVPGENLEARIGERQHVYMPQRVAERGDDYEIVRFKEMVRES